MALNEPGGAVRPRRALVTGASGFVGSRLVRHLVAAGWTVHLLLRERSATDALGAVLPFVEVHRLGAGDGIDAMQRAVGEAAPEVVFQLASLFIAQHRPADVQPLVDANIGFGALLLEAMQAHGVNRLVNTGTGWQHYGGAGYDPVNLYAATKQAFEALLQHAVSVHGLRALTLKLHDTYGPGDPRPKLMRILCEAARTGAALDMSPGEQLLDLVHVDEAVRAFEAAAGRVLDMSAPAHEVYGLSGGERLTLRELVGRVERTSGRPMRVSFGARSYRPREVMVPAELPLLPHWRPAIALDQGLAELLRPPA